MWVRFPLRGLFMKLVIFILYKLINKQYMSIKEQILELRKANKSYNEISKILGISKSTISFHCKSMGINEPIDGVKKFNSENNIKNLNDFYKNHTIEETSNHFNISRTTIIKYTNAKREKLCNDEKRRRNYLNVKNRIQKLKKMSVDYLGGKCIRCGYDKSIWALEFHHKNPTDKDFTISNYGTRSWEKLKNEIDKCILVCSNCHREIHEEIFNKK